MAKSIASAVDNLKYQPVILVKKTRLLQMTQKLHVSEKLFLKALYNNWGGVASDLSNAICRNRLY